MVPLVGEQLTLDRACRDDDEADRHRDAIGSKHHPGESSRRPVEHHESRPDRRPLEGEEPCEQADQRVRRCPDEPQPDGHAEHGSALDPRYPRPVMADRSSGATLDVPELAIELGVRFADAGHQLFLVGGSVRDLLLGRTVSDLDFATSAHPTETTKVLHGWADRRYFVGVRFGTVGALKGGTRLEITTFRQEVYASRTGSRRSPTGTTSRRTSVDAISRSTRWRSACPAASSSTRTVGWRPWVRASSTRRRIPGRVLRRSLADDPRRPVRGAAGCRPRRADPRRDPLDARSPRHRGRRTDAAEIDKLLVAEHPAKGLSLLVETGLADLFLPELPALQLEQDPVHQHKDVLRHTYAVVERCEADLVLRLAGLLHDIGKPKTRQITPEGSELPPPRDRRRPDGEGAAHRAPVPERRHR
jgi:hypothetical protein